MNRSGKLTSPTHCCEDYGCLKDSLIVFNVRGIYRELKAMTFDAPRLKPEVEGEHRAVVENRSCGSAGIAGKIKDIEVYLVNGFRNSH